MDSPWQETTLSGPAWLVAKFNTFDAAKLLSATIAMALTIGIAI